VGKKFPPWWEDAFSKCFSFRGVPPMDVLLSSHIYTIHINNRCITDAILACEERECSESSSEAWGASAGTGVGTGGGMDTFSSRSHLLLRLQHVVSETEKVEACG